MNIKKYAAIDIGSNAMRLLITNILEYKSEIVFNKSEIIRVPIRLGQDAFTVGEISEKNIARMQDAMQAFRLLMRVYGVERYAACATSAMREAYNGSDLAKYIKEKTEIDIEIIDGKKEAKIIANSQLKNLIATEQNFLFIDVGGGSTELTIFSEGKQITSKSFKNGTVRLLNNMVNQQVWDSMEEWIKINTQPYNDVVMIGSGGNINKVFKMSGKAQGKSLSYTYLNKQFNMLSKLTYDQRVTDLGLNHDRADVIVPALNIYRQAMKWSKAKKIYVPKIGLSDGIIKASYFQNSGIRIHDLV